MIKAAKIYLYAVSVCYVLIGIGGFAEFFERAGEAIQYVFFPSFVLGMLSPYFLVVPYIDFQIFDRATNLPFLGIVSLILGVIAYIALWRSQRNTRWIYIIYTLCVFAILVTARNAVYPRSLVDTEWRLWVLLGVSYTCLYILATGVYHRALRREQKNFPR